MVNSQDMSSLVCLADSWRCVDGCWEPSGGALSNLCPEDCSVVLRRLEESFLESPLLGRWRDPRSRIGTMQLQGSSPSGSERLLNELYLKLHLESINRVNNRSAIEFYFSRHAHRPHPLTTPNDHTHWTRPKTKYWWRCLLNSSRNTH